MIKKLLFLAFISSSLLGLSQSLKYKITTKNIEIGFLTVDRIISENSVSIEAKSEVKIHVFKTIDISYTLKSIYIGNHLNHSSVISYVNGKIHSSCETTKEGNTYKIHQDEKHSEITEIIDFSGAMMYYEEPINKDKVYSEFNSVIKDIKKVGEHTYELYEPNGSLTNTYYYENGVLAKAVNPHHIANFELIKLNSIKE